MTPATLLILSKASMMYATIQISFNVVMSVLWQQIVSTVEPVIPVNQGIDIAFSVQCTE